VGNHFLLALDRDVEIVIRSKLRLALRHKGFSLRHEGSRKGARILVTAA